VAVPLSPCRCGRAAVAAPLVELATSPCRPRHARCSTTTSFRAASNVAASSTIAPIFERVAASTVECVGADASRDWDIRFEQIRF
jgi:hypothetical protein